MWASHLGLSPDFSTHSLTPSFLPSSLFPPLKILRITPIPALPPYRGAVRITCDRKTTMNIKGVILQLILTYLREREPTTSHEEAECVELVPSPSSSQEAHCETREKGECSARLQLETGSTKSRP